MTISRILLIVLILASIPVQARMYQWKDPETGTTQLSGKPPAWYRSDEGGPRIIVFDKGRIIDDTNIRVSDEERESLRLQALVNVENDRETARKKMLEAEQMKSKLDIVPEGKEQVTESEVPETPQQEIKTPGDDSGEQTRAPGPEEEKMRKLISDWEKLMTEQAKREAGSSYMNIRQGTEKATQEAGSDYFRMENKTSE